MRPRRRLGVRQDVDALHADLTETSVMMARHPALVATDRLERGLMGRVDADELMRRGLKAMTPNGIVGDARAATPEIGAAVRERLQIISRRSRAESSTAGKEPRGRSPPLYEPGTSIGRPLRLRLS
jgi:Creatinine amidohydrolase